MNITFLIGNGFDRNLGLLTSYSDFVKFYKTTVGNTTALKQFRDYINENQELWSDAEIALGKYTSQFKEGQAEVFSECQTDFCESLASYLMEQEKRIDYKESASLIKKAFSRVEEIINVFPTQEQSVINDVIKKRASENIRFNFLCFNYTSTLDNCLRIVKSSTGTLGSHEYGNKLYNHSIGNICHVHGTVEKEMVFGVNDESQIANIDIFDCEDGDIYKRLLIKVEANASYLENTDAKAKALIDNSDILYVYGMSIGESDKIWWDRICTWLLGVSDRHLIIQKYSFQMKHVIPLKYQLAERKEKRRFMSFSNFDQNRKNLIEKRIHITDENIFEDIEAIAKDLTKERAKLLAVLEKLREGTVMNGDDMGFSVV